MLIDLQKFMDGERPFWNELEQRLASMETNLRFKMSLLELQRFHYLYERVSADLAKIATFSSEPDLRRYLESLVARAYGEIQETRARRHRFHPAVWFFQTLPQTFRRHVNAFWLSAAVTVAGMLFGGLALTFDEEAKAVILPEQFAHLLNNPAERVAREEHTPVQAGTERMASFSAQLMTNNIKVSLKALALGMTYGIGTLILLFYNGVIVGLIAADYLLAGQAVFLLGWLLPHGSIEIPAILIGGQCGLILAGALLDRGRRQTVVTRLRAVSRDLVTLISGGALLLVWAGLVEAFFSQLHEPVIPYGVKIGFGAVELILLYVFLGHCGRADTSSPASAVEGAARWESRPTLQP
jgi:uncharacterized membrane protein SpoIIM required for sporulation